MTDSGCEDVDVITVFGDVKSGDIDVEGNADIGIGEWHGWELFCDSAVSSEIVESCSCEWS